MGNNSSRPRAGSGASGASLASLNNTGGSLPYGSINATPKKSETSILPNAIDQFKEHLKSEYFADAKQKEAYRDGLLLGFFCAVGGVFPSKFFLNHPQQLIQKYRETFPSAPEWLWTMGEYSLKVGGLTLNSVFNGAAYDTVYKRVLRDWFGGFIIASYLNIRDKTWKHTKEAVTNGLLCGLNLGLTLLGVRGFVMSANDVIGAEDAVWRILTNISNTGVVSSGVSQVEDLAKNTSARLYMNNVSENSISAPLPSAEETESTPLNTNPTALVLSQQLVYLLLKDYVLRLGHLSTYPRPSWAPTIFGYCDRDRLNEMYETFKHSVNTPHYNEAFKTLSFAAINEKSILEDTFRLTNDPKLTFFNLTHLLLAVALPIFFTFAAIIGYTLLIAENAKAKNTTADWILAAFSMMPDYGIVLEFCVGAIKTLFAMSTLAFISSSLNNKVFWPFVVLFSVFATFSFAATSNATWNGMRGLNAPEMAAFALQLATSLATVMVNVLAVLRVGELITKYIGFARKNEELVNSARFIGWKEELTQALQAILDGHTTLTQDECGSILNAIYELEFPQTTTNSAANEASAAGATFSTAEVPATVVDISLKDSFEEFIQTSANLHDLLKRAKASGLSPIKVWKENKPLVPSNAGSSLGLH